MVFFDLHYTQLLSLGCHIGHSKNNTLFYSAWLVLAFRQTTAIINLFKSIVMFRFAFLILSNVIIFNGPIWFVTMERSIDRYARAAALYCGEFSMTSKWIRGAISNYPAVFSAYRRLSNKPLAALSAKNRSRRFSYSNWFFSRFSWPRFVFLPSLSTSYAVSKEALSLSIPCVAIADTNAQSQAASLAIPGNDESLICLVFYNDLLSNFILSRKFNAVSSWFLNTRSVSRVLSFASWLSGQYLLSDNLSLINLINFRPNVITNYFKAFATAFSMNYWKFTFKEGLDVFYDYSLNFNASRFFSVFAVRKRKLLVFLNFTFIKGYTTFYGLYRRKFLTPLNFKLRFLTKKFLKRYYNFKYSRGRAKHHLNERTRIVRNFSRYYFLIRYNRFKVLRPQYKQYSNYWSLFFDAFAHTRTTRFLSKVIFSRISYKHRLRRRPFLDLSPVKSLYVVRFFPQKWKFYVNNMYFDNRLESFYWKWSKGFWATDKKALNKYFLGYWYVLPKKYDYFNNAPTFYSGYRFNYIKHKFYATAADGIKWRWY